MGEYAPDGGIYKGNLYFDEFVNNVLTGERDVGNARLYTITAPAIEQKEKLSQRIENYGQLLESKIMKNQRKVKVSLDDLAGEFKDNLVMFMFGNKSVITEAGGAVSAESITAHLGKGSMLSKRRVLTSPAPVVKAVTPDAWADEQAYALTAFVLAGTYRAECTTAGTSSTVEPTWAGKVPGDTVTDGSVTWTIRKLTYTVAVDYEVSTTGAITHIVPISTGAITAGQLLKVDYSTAAYTGYLIQADTTTQKDVFIRMIGKNIDNNEDVIVRVFKVRLKPTSDMLWITDDYVALELEGDVMATDDGIPWDVEVLEAA
ncbi:MAG: hypothetical protein WC769_01580 [Thermodesulfovibrionales bacterium]|jgi:hypothetical protein